MTTSKKNIILAALLVAQVALIAFLYRPGQQAAPVAANLFPSLTPDQVSGLTVTDDQGKTLTLVKKEGWQITPGDLPADKAKIEGLLKKFAELKGSRLVSQTAASHSRLKVGETNFNRKVEFSQGDKKTLFFLGTSPSSKSIHLRLAEAKEVYQINDLSAWEFQAENESWWQGKYLSLPQADLTGLTIANAQGTIDLVKEEKKGWQLKAEPDTTLDGKRVETVVNALSEITISSYLAKEFTPQGEPVATVTYRTKAGETTLKVWAKEKPEDPEQVVKASTTAFPAKVKEYAVKEAVEVKLAGLKAKPVASGETSGSETSAEGTTPEVAAPPAELTPAEAVQPPLPPDAPPVPAK